MGAVKGSDKTLNTWFMVPEDKKALSGHINIAGMEEIFGSFKKLTSSTLPAAKTGNGDTKAIYWLRKINGKMFTVSQRPAFTLKTKCKHFPQRLSKNFRQVFASFPFFLFPPSAVFSCCCLATHAIKIAQINWAKDCGPRRDSTERQEAASAAKTSLALPNKSHPFFSYGPSPKCK